MGYALGQLQGLGGKGGVSMHTDFFYPSKGVGKVHACRGSPEQPPVAIVQIIHGIAEHVERYQDFAQYLNRLGYLVVAEDHMGHGKTINGGGIQGYFRGGWFTAVDDSYALLQSTRREFPELPYFLFGHSMGSFMTRTILCKYPNSGISGAILCGTGWQPKAVLSTGIAACEAFCKIQGEKTPSRALERLVFSGYNQKVEHPKTAYDWLTRDSRIVEAYLSDPLCGFTPTAGLMRDMLKGIRFIQAPRSLFAMKNDLPVFFIAGGDDPVGSYGKGVLRAADAFRSAAMADVSCKIYPLGRHEILNEINKEEVYQDVAAWLEKKRLAPGK